MMLAPFFKSCSNIKWNHSKPLFQATILTLESFIGVKTREKGRKYILLAILPFMVCTQKHLDSKDWIWLKGAVGGKKLCPLLEQLKRNGVSIFYKLRNTHLKQKIDHTHFFTCPWPVEQGPLELCDDASEWGGDPFAQADWVRRWNSPRGCGRLLAKHQKTCAGMWEIQIPTLEINCATAVQFL